MDTKLTSITTQKFEQVKGTRPIAQQNKKLTILKFYKKKKKHFTGKSYLNKFMWMNSLSIFKLNFSEKGGILSKIGSNHASILLKLYLFVHPYRKLTFQASNNTQHLTFHSTTLHVRKTSTWHTTHNKIGVSVLGTGRQSIKEVGDIFAFYLVFSHTPLARSE